MEFFKISHRLKFADIKHASWMLCNKRSEISIVKTEKKPNLREIEINFTSGKKVGKNCDVAEKM